MQLILNRIIDKLLMSVVFSSKPYKPGVLIKSLNDEERKVLSKATSKDFYHRIK